MTTSLLSDEADLPEPAAAGRWRPDWRGIGRGALGFGFDASILPMFGIAIMGHFGKSGWLLDMPNFFRPHIAMVALLLMAPAILLRSRVRIAAGVVVFAAAAFPLIFVDVPMAPHSRQSDYRVMTVNVMGGRQPAGVLTGMVEDADPDIMVAQEVQHFARGKLTSLPALPYVAGPDLNTSIVVASRYPIKAQRLTFPSNSEPREDIGGGGALRIEVERPGAGRPLVVYAIHSPTPRSDRGWRVRNNYLAHVALRAAADARRANVVVMGDWNTPYWSPFFDDFLARTGLRSTERSAWPSATRIFIEYGLPNFLGTPIDHIAVSSGIGLARLAVGRRFGSDHLPVVADIDLR